jgi:hypothetical protein
MEKFRGLVQKDASYQISPGVAGTPASSADGPAVGGRDTLSCPPVSKCRQE